MISTPISQQKIQIQIPTNASSIPIKQKIYEAIRNAASAFTLKSSTSIGFAKCAMSTTLRRIAFRRARASLADRQARRRRFTGAAPSAVKCLTVFRRAKVNAVTAALDSLRSSSAATATSRRARLERRRARIAVSAKRISLLRLTR